MRFCRRCWKMALVGSLRNPWAGRVGGPCVGHQMFQMALLVAGDRVGGVGHGLARSRSGSMCIMAVIVDSFWSCGGSLAGESVRLEVLGVWIWLESHAKLVAGEADREAGDRGQVGGRGAHFVDLGVNLGGGGGGGCCLGNLTCVGLDDYLCRGGVGGWFC